MANCVDKIREKYPKLSRVEAQRLVKAYDDLDAQFNMDKARLAEMRRAKADDVTKAALKRQISRVSNIKALRKNLEFVLQPEFRGKPKEGMDALVLFTGYNPKAEVRNINAVADSFRGRFESYLNQMLDRNNVRDWIGQPEMSKKIYQDFYDRVNGTHTPNKYGAEVSKFVDDVIKLNKSMIKAMRSIGSTIEFNESHLVSQNYDPLKVQRSDTWVDDMVGALDLDKSFGPGTSPETAKGILEEMKTRMGLIDDEKADVRSSFVGGRRAFVYKDGEAAFMAADKYGFSDFNTALQQGVSRLAKRYGSVFVFGDNPSEGIKDLRNYVNNVMSMEVDYSTFDAGLARYRGAGNVFQDPEGAMARIVEPSARWVKSLTTLQFLGSSAPKMMMDIPLTTLTQISKGMSPLRATFQPLAKFINALPEKNRAEVARLSWVAMENGKKHILDELGVDMGNEMYSSKVANFAHKVYGMDFVGKTLHSMATEMAMDGLTDVIRRGPKSRLSMDTIRSADLSGFDATKLRNMLDRNNAKYISPYDILNDTDLGTREYREELSTKVATYYNQTANQSLTTRDTRMDIWQRKDKPRDDAGRLALSLASTFMTSVTKETINVLKATRKIAPNGHVYSAGGAAILGSSLVYMAMWDYATDEMKKVASGKWEDIEPSKEDIAQSLIEGGGAGILVNGMIRMSDGRWPVPPPAFLSTFSKLKKHSQDEFYRTTGMKATTRKRMKHRSGNFVERNLEFALELSPHDKFWATGLLNAINTHIIDDVGKRQSRRRRRK